MIELYSDRAEQQRRSKRTAEFIFWSVMFVLFFCYGIPAIYFSMGGR